MTAKDNEADSMESMMTFQPVDGIRDDVDPDIRVFQQTTNEAYARLSGGAYADVAERRRVAEAVREPWAAGGPDMASSEDLSIGERGLRIRIHRPVAAESLPVLLYLHGGGWTLFSVDTHDRLMREYAARTGCAVVGLDYRLAPEARFPAPLHDTAAAIGWIAQNGAAHGLDGGSIAIGGDSAGGNLALATALSLRDRGGPKLAGLLLNYAAIDLVERPSHRRYEGDAYMLTSVEMMNFWDDYLGPDNDRDDPLARPLLADLHGLPPTFLCIAECDILVDENRELARLLAEAGNDVRAEIYPGATHSFLEAMSISPLARRALDDASAWLRDRLFA